MIDDVLYLAMRPTTFKRVVGQDDAVNTLKGLLQKSFPRATLFSGDSGCGKTTLARIVVKKLNCGNEDFKEINCADFRGIDMVRDIRRKMSLDAWDGDCRIWLIDEAHRLSSEAQDAFLKILEDTPKHVYFMLATTEPEKLSKTIRTRCTQINVRALTGSEIGKVVKTACLKKGIRKLSSDVRSKLIDAADGSARKALVLLHQIAELSEKDRLSAIIASDAKIQANQIFKGLMDRIPWPAMAKILKLVTDEPERVRQYLLVAATNLMLAGVKGLSARANAILNELDVPLFDSKTANRANLIAACYRILQ